MISMTNSPDGESPQLEPSADERWEQLGVHPQLSTKRSSKSKRVAIGAIVVALAAGGLATRAAASATNSTGAATPRAAIQTIIDDLDQSDFIGVLDDLAPGERAALVNPFTDGIDQLKRLKVLSNSANPGKVSGVRFQASDLTFSAKPVRINDHVQIVELTGGKITLGADLSSVPFAGDFLKAAFPHGVQSKASNATTFDVAQEVRSHGAVRLAAQKVDGRWYPSIGYTVADNAAHHAGLSVSARDYVAPKGAPTATDAVKGVINAALGGNPRGVIELLSPDELPAVHDYAGLILRRIPSFGPIGAKITSMQFATTPISGGERVMLTALDVRLKNGKTFGYRVRGNCIDTSVSGKSQHKCSADIGTAMISALQSAGMVPNVTPAQRDALAHAFATLTKVGIETSKSHGKWYVTPVRSSLDITDALASGLQGNDLLALVGLLAHR